MKDPNTIDFAEITKDNWEELTGATDDDRIDVAFGIYIFASDHHSGQWSIGYRVLSALDCHSGNDYYYHIIRGDAKDPSGEWSGARKVYQQMLASKWVKEF